MSFSPVYSCDAPGCDESCEAGNDEELLAQGWLTLNVCVDPQDEESRDVKQMDFCTRTCLEAHIREAWVL